MATRDATSAAPLPGARDLSAVDSRFTKQWKWVKSSETGFQTFYRGVWSLGKTIVASLATLITKVSLFVTTGFSSLYTESYSFFKKDLSELKEKIGIPDSDFNRTQLYRIFNVEGQAFKSDSTRIKNLNRVLTKTENSLSSGAHGTSKARGKEDRYFHAEGCKFIQDTSGSSTAEFIAAKHDLVSAIHAEIKATDKYTMQKGNSASSISRRDYVIEGVLKFAREQGLAEQFVTSAILERSANPNPQEADEQFIQTLQAGVAHNLLSTEDPQLGAALEHVARVAMMEVEAQNQASGYFGKKANPDAVVAQLGNAFKAAGLLPNDDLAQFIYNVHNKAGLADDGSLGAFRSRSASGVDSGTGSASGVGSKSRAGLAAEAEEGAAGIPAFEDDVDAASSKRVAPSNETPAQAKARLKSVNQAAADADLGPYLQNLKNLRDAQKVLIDHLAILKLLLKIKSGDDLKNLSKEQLRAIVQASRRLGLAVRADRTKPENLDADILNKRADIEAQVAEVARLRALCVKPANFKQAAKANRTQATRLEKEIKTNDSTIKHEQGRIVHWEGVVQKVEAGIRATVAKGVPLAIGQPDEEELPDFAVVEEGAAPKKPGFFSKLFKRNPKPAVEKQLAFAAAASDDVELPDLTVAADLPQVQAKKRFWQ